jgi:hypothetical protein
MKKEKEIPFDEVQWEMIEALESIANQCIYKGKDVSKARAILKSVYQNEQESQESDKPPQRS